MPPCSGGALPDVETDTVIDALRRMGGRTRPTGGWDSLTATEVIAAHHVAEGRSNAEIAVQMGVARSTVKTHLLHIFTKLSVTSRAELAATVVRHRLPPGGAAERSDTTPCPRQKTDRQPGST